MVRRAGFTLIELLLVLVIIGVITAVTIPEFVRSMRGNRLRTAARTVVAAGRYARSMAVLHQRAIAVDFSLDGAALVVDAYRPAPVTNAADQASGSLSSFALAEQSLDREEQQAIASGPGMKIRIERTLDAVTIADVQFQQGTSESPDDDKLVRVVYESNGRCTPYRVRIQDEEGGSMTIDVDALGSAELSRRNTV